MLALCASASALAKSPPVFDPNAEPAALAHAFLKNDKVDALAAVKRIAIVEYRVEFGVENSAKATSSGTTGWTASSSDIKLVGPSDADRQAIADRLYDDFVAGLTQLGFEVLPYDVVKADKSYQSMSAKFQTRYEPWGTQLGKSAFVGARGIPYYFTNEDKHMGLSVLSSGGFTVQPQNIEPSIAKSLDAAVVRATIDVQFADMKTSGGIFHSSSSVKTSEGLTIVPEMSQYRIVVPGAGTSRIVLDETVAIASDSIDMKDITTSGQKTSEAVGNALGVVLGTGGAHTTRHYEATATPEGYRQALDQYVGRFQQAALAMIGGGVGRAYQPSTAEPAPETVPAVETMPAGEATPVADTVPSGD